MSALLAYLDAWVGGDPDRIAALVDEQCVIVESDGSVYRGRAEVRRWAEAWFAAGGVVHAWAASDHVVADSREAAQWTFECTWNGHRGSFDGATIARIEAGLVRELREYQSTGPLHPGPHR